MNQSNSISPAEYLAMHFPDREPEYVRGELLYSPFPDRAHGWLQVWLGVLLVAALEHHGLSVEFAVRCQLEADNFRLPDVAVFRPEQSDDLLPKDPPLVAIRDRLARREILRTAREAGGLSQMACPEYLGR